MCEEEQGTRLPGGPCCRMERELNNHSRDAQLRKPTPSTPDASQEGPCAICCGIRGNTKLSCWAGAAEALPVPPNCSEILLWLCFQLTGLHSTLGSPAMSPWAHRAVTRDALSIPEQCFPGSCHNAIEVCIRRQCCCRSLQLSVDGSTTLPVAR